MTIEEAINVLEDGAWWDDYSFSRPETNDSDRAKDELLDAIDVAIVALRAQQEAEKNEPLTRDELLTMDGEPVWCVDGNGNASWCLICVSHDKGCVFLDAVDNETGLWDGDYYGMTGDGEHGLHRLGWIAYRRPLFEKEHDD